MSFDPKSMSVASTTQATMSSVTQTQATSSQQGQLSSRTVEQLPTRSEIDERAKLIEQVQIETLSKMTKAMVQELCALVVIDETASQKDKQVFKLVPERVAKLTALLDILDEVELKKNFTDKELLFLNIISAGIEDVHVNLDMLCPPLAPLLKPEINEKRMKKLFTCYLVAAMKIVCEKINKISQDYFNCFVPKLEEKKDVVLGMVNAVFEKAQKLKNFSKEELEELNLKIHPTTVEDLDPSQFSKDHLFIAQEFMSFLKEELSKEKTNGEGFLHTVRAIISVAIQQIKEEEKQAAAAKK